MKIIPQGMRGNVYIVTPSGSVVANQTSLDGGIHFMTPSVSRTIPSINRQSSNVRPMSYPPTGGAGGAFIRWYSQQGMNAMYGYATFPCDSSYANGDSGLMYFNAYDVNGNDVVDNGLAQNFVGGYGPQWENAFVRLASGGAVYSGWTNENDNYNCGIPMGIMYGTLAAGGTYGEGYSFLGVGGAAYDPTQMSLPPSSTVWIAPAWTFYPTPSSLQTGVVAWGSDTTNCAQCSVARMFTLAQNSPGDDGSCFGWCNGAPNGRWDEVVAGNLISPCDNSVSPFICTIAYQSSWQGGLVTSNNGEVTSEFSQQSGLEGINTNASGYTTDTAEVGQFASPLPRAPLYECTTDADGYCAVAGAAVAAGSCNLGTVGGKPITGHITKTPYQIFKMVKLLELQETATETNTQCSTPSVTWSPANPATTYSDSSLP